MNATPRTDTRPAATAPANAEPTVHVWDDPASRIQFVETVCQGKDWKATVFARPGVESDRLALNDLALQLKAKGYACHPKHDDENGVDSLEIHHLGDHVGFLANLRALGFTEGGKRSFTHLAGTTAEHLRHGADVLKNLVSDPARATATAYLAGDLSFSAKTFNDLHHGHLGDRLVGASGVLAAIQSLIYMRFARDTGEVAVGDVQADVERALKKGGDPLDEENWRKRRSGHGPVRHVAEVFRHHPIEAGASAQIAGQVLFGASGLVELSKGNPAAASYDLARAGLSGAAWWILMQDPKHYDHKHEWYNPQRWKEELLSHPQFASAVLASTASTVGLRRTLREARNEATGLFEWQKLDKVRALGETQYLVGDGVMFALNKSHYGGAEGAVDLGAEAAAKLIGDSNIVFGWKEEGDFVKRLSSYIGRRIVEETTRENAYPDHEAYLRAIETKSEEIVPRLGQAITEKLANRGRRFTSIAHAAAAVVHTFPKEDQAAVIDGLAKVLSQTKAVYASDEEFRLVVTGQVGKLAAIDPSVKTKPSFSDLAGAISNLQIALPGYDPSRAMFAVYDTLKPHCVSQQVDRFAMEKSLRDMAKRDDLPDIHRAQIAANQNASRAAGVAS